MNNSTQLTTQAIVLPEVAQTFEGYEFFPRSHVWKLTDLSDRRIFNFRSIANRVTPELITEFKYVMLWYLQNGSMTHAYIIYYRFVFFIRQIPYDRLPISRIGANDLINFKSTLTKRTEWHLGTLSVCFKKWGSLGLKAIDSQALRFLSEIKLKGTVKGEAVRTMDPETGPYTDLELQAIYSSLHNFFGEGRIGLEDYLLVTMAIVFGVRPVQLAALKITDFFVIRSGDGMPTYSLNMPRAKQRNLHARQSFRTRSLIPAIGRVLETWISYQRRHYEQNFDKKISTENLPIFCRWNNSMPPGFEHHDTAAGLGYRIKDICNQFNILSERTGEHLKISARRFRYTLGTRAAEEGRGELIIADLLDHTDTQNVGVYVEATSNIAERIDKATAMELAPIAQAFMGLIVDSESDAKRGNEYSSRVGRPDVGNLGSCGKYGFCGGLAPIACYTCNNFQPWRDAPHEELLDALLAERARTFEITGDERITSVNDRTILAVADVVHRCNELKTTGTNENV